MSITPQTRWLVRKDLPHVLTIEAECFEYPWGESDFIETLQQRNCIALVAEYQHAIVGYMVYELKPRSLELLNFAVHPECRYQGVGSTMMRRLIDKLTPRRRTSIRMFIRERNLDAQLFLSRMDFYATEVHRDFYEDTDESAYRFVYVRAHEQPVEVPHEPAWGELDAC